MNVNNRKTILVMKEQRLVPQNVKDELKIFVKIKKLILKELKKSSMTVPELSKKINLPNDKTLYYLMSLLKYGLIEVDKIDDMDEFFYYKLKGND